MIVGLLLGAAAVILSFRTDLFDQKATARRSPSAERSVSSSTSTTVLSSESGTVALGPDQSLLDKDELRRAIDSLTKGKGEGEDKRPALTVVVRERQVSVVFSPTGTQAPHFDPRSLPYERFPALVEEARTTLGVHSPKTWQISADRLTGFPSPYESAWPGPTARPHWRRTKRARWCGAPRRTELGASSATRAQRTVRVM